MWVLGLRVGMVWSGLLRCSLTAIKLGHFVRNNRFHNLPNQIISLDVLNLGFQVSRTCMGGSTLGHPASMRF